MTEDLAVPGGMRLTIWHGLDDFTIVPAAEVLAVPTGIRGRYEGSGTWLPPESGPLIRFSFSWLSVPGASLLGALGLARELAGHLAAMAGQWPSGVAHTVLLPVIDTNYGFEVTPEERRRPPAPHPAVFEGLGLGGRLGLPS